MDSRIKLEINLSKLKENYEYIKSKTKARVLAVIKSDAYGLGIDEIGRTLLQFGVKDFAVGSLDEYKILRGLNSEIKIYFLNPIVKENFLEIDNNTITSIHSIGHLKNYIVYLGDRIKEFNFEIYLNTGMNRGGIKKEEIGEMLALINENSINIEGIFSHFADASGDLGFTEKQFEEFMEIDKILSSKINYSNKHIANSAGFFLDEKYHLDMVRVGMALFGLQPLRNRKIEELKEIVSLEAKVINVFSVKKGERIGYGNLLAEKDTKIAIVSIGYGDSYSGAFAGNGKVLIRGEYSRILGEICMDQLLVDVSGVERLELEEKVVLIGLDGEKRISVSDLSNWSGLLGDEIYCSFSKLNKKYV